MTPSSGNGNGRTRSPAAARPRRGLGTFAGVFTPSILTILGIILFQRLGFVVGAAGLPRALAIILIANGISVLTSISLAAVATNLRVKAGGDYYLISRTLGVGFGGALGLVLFLAQSVSIAFYAFGFGEAMTAVMHAPPAWMPQALAAGAVATLFVLAWLGADWASRFQYVVMAALALALGAFLLGGSELFDTDLLDANAAAAPSLPFWAIFAIFFPAVTGFTQGVSMSGDLEDPGRSLPLGTFAAVGISAVIYLVVAVVFAGAVPHDTLVGNYSAMRGVAPAAWLIDLGVIAATLSSALASFLGAPRILQSLAADRVFRSLTPFAVGHGPANNPRRGVLLSTAIALLTIGLGDLNLIAPLVSMFFLLSYGLLNTATWYEAKANSPSFRPRFRWFHRNLSLVGAGACLAVMLALDPVTGALAVAILTAIYLWVERNAGVERWADSSRSHHLQRVRVHLLAMTSELEHPRDWRPVILAFSDDAERRARLLRFASWIEGGAGFATVVKVLEGQGPVVRRQRTEVEAELRAEITRQGVEAFALAITAPVLDTGIQELVQSHGLGGVRANTVLVNWFDRVPDPDDQQSGRLYARRLRIAQRHGCHLVILEATTEELARLDATPADERRIDVWYQHDDSGRLMLLFAYLATRHEVFRDATLRVLLPRDGAGLPIDASDDAIEAPDADPDGPPDESALRATAQRLLHDARIEATVELVPDLDPETIMATSLDTPLVFLPFRLKGETILGPQEAVLDELLLRIPITALVLAAQDVDLDTEPESGLQGSLAEAQDLVTRAAAVLRAADKDAARASALVEKTRAERDAARGVGQPARHGSRPDEDELDGAPVADTAAPEPAVEDEKLAALEKALEQAEQDAERQRRRAAKLRAKFEQAAKEVGSLLEEPVAETAPPGEEAPADEASPAPADETP